MFKIIVCTVGVLTGLHYAQIGHTNYAHAASPTKPSSTKSPPTKSPSPKSPPAPGQKLRAVYGDIWQAALKGNQSHAIGMAEKLSGDQQLMGLWMVAMASPTGIGYPHLERLSQSQPSWPLLSDAAAKHERYVLMDKNVQEYMVWHTQRSQSGTRLALSMYGQMIQALLALDPQFERLQARQQNILNEDEDDAQSHESKQKWAHTQEQARINLRTLWIKLDASKSEWDHLAPRLKPYLNAETRMQRIAYLYWSGKWQQARLEAFETPAIQPILKLIFEMIDNPQDAAAIFAKAPPIWQAHPMLTHALARGLRKSDNYDDATLLWTKNIPSWGRQKQGKSLPVGWVALHPFVLLNANAASNANALNVAKPLQHPAYGAARLLIAEELRIIARTFVVDGWSDHDKLKRAFHLIRLHGLSPAQSSFYSEAEWLTGWLALRIGQPALAARHFDRMASAVKTPISQAKSLYWMAKAERAQGHLEASRRYMLKAAKHPQTFYGQRAAFQLGYDHVRIEPYPAADPEALRWLKSSPQWTGLVNLVQDSKAFGVPIQQILTHWGKQLRTPQRFLSLQHAIEDLVPLAHRNQFRVQTARASYAQGFMLHTMAFALDEHVRGYSRHVHKGVPSELFLALARQESGFNPLAVSSAGAIGMVQILPATAAQEASKLKLSFKKSDLSERPDLNIKLGTHYLDGLIREFRSWPLALAAYNAGESRVRIWAGKMGNPIESIQLPSYMTQGTDAFMLDAEHPHASLLAQEERFIDWIESIPYSETRNYGPRILEAMPFYQSPGKLHGALRIRILPLSRMHVAAAS